MEIILLEKVVNLGNLGDKVTVSPGYGRNFLIPKGKAVRATADKLAEFEQRRAELEKKAADELAAAQTRADALAKLNVTITQKAGEEGRLYGSVGAKDIADAVTSAGIELHKNEVRLPAGPIRNVGDYEIKLHLHADLDGVLALKIVGE
ncbi:50S ribosomal protein L9 [Anaerolineae bacterium]|nr:50S ribosomal protein L9 [Anaerolineae bacterium]